MPEINNEQLAAAFVRFYKILAKLRAPDGCPWDRAQTPFSMRSDLIEETFEVVDAITEEDSAHIKEELGDVMLNTAMIAYMHEQCEQFTMADLLTEVSDKLVRRHPHVFPESEGRSQVEETVKTPEQVLSQWDKIKNNIEGRKGSSILDEVSAGLPPLMRAAKLQKKAAKLGFDWKSPDAVYPKVLEELKELQEAHIQYEKSQSLTQSVTEAAPCDAEIKAKQHMEEEAGDLLFSVVNVLRCLKIDPCVALNGANKKFYRRFTYVEQQMKEKNIPFGADTLTQMDAFWDEAKKIERTGK